MQGILKKSFVIMIAAIVMTASFGFTLDPASAATGPTSISLKVASASYGSVVDIKGKVRVDVSSVLPSTASKSVNWSIISGSSYGKIYSSTSTYCYIQGIKMNGTNPGVVTLKAKSKYYPYNYRIVKIYVKQLYPSSVSINKVSMNMWVGMTKTLTATVVKKPWVYDAGVTWSSSVKGVATVGSTTGKVISALAATGSTTIKAKSNDSTKYDTCPVKVYTATLAEPVRVNLASGTTFDNPATVTGPSATTTVPTRTTTYANVDPTNDAKIATVSSTGKVTASSINYGSVKMKVSVRMLASPATSTAAATYTNKYLYYVVNVKDPIVGDAFTMDENWGHLELTHAADGFLGDTTIVLSRGQLDDLFGYGSLGIDVWNPMDMYMNFQTKNIAWHAGDFAFDKVMQSDINLADVEIVPNTTGQVPTVHPYWLDSASGDKNCVELYEGPGGVISGYEILFYQDNTFNEAASDRISLDGNALTLQYGGSEAKLVRSQLNQVQAFATADGDGTLNDLIFTITRSMTGYSVVVNDPAYLDAKGVEFSLYETYL